MKVLLGSLGDYFNWLTLLFLMQESSSHMISMQINRRKLTNMKLVDEDEQLVS